MRRLSLMEWVGYSAAVFLLAASVVQPQDVTCTPRHQVAATWLDYETHQNEVVGPATVQIFTTGFFTDDITVATLKANEWSHDGFWTTPNNKVPASVIVHVNILTVCVGRYDRRRTDQ